MRLTETASSGWTLKLLLYGGLTVVLMWLFSIFLAGSIGPLRTIGLTQRCQANQTRILQAFGIYAADFQDVLPQYSKWMDQVGVYIDHQDRFRCPAVTGPASFGYGMNEKAAGLSRDVTHRAITLIFDSTNTFKNFHSTVVDTPPNGRHLARITKGKAFERGNIIGSIGGAIKFVPISIRTSR